MGNQTLDEAKREIWDQTGHGNPPPVPLAPPAPPGGRQPRPYDDPRLSELPPGHGVVTNTAVTLDILAKDRQRSQATDGEAQREREKTARDSRARSERRQELQRTEETTARTVTRREADRGRGEARLGQLADEYRAARGQIPTEGPEAVLAAVMGLRERFEVALGVARQLETAETSVNVAIVQHQAAAYHVDNPDDVDMQEIYRIRIDHGGAWSTRPRRARDFLVAVSLPGDPEPSTAELAGEAAARVLEPMVRAQRELEPRCACSESES